MEPKANWLDRAISWVSPSYGLRRSLARARQGLVEMSYEGVRSSRRQGGWRADAQATGTSGNAEIGPAAAILRENAEDLVRNNAFASKGARRWSRRVVGYGIRPQADTGNENLNAIIDAKWEEWAPLCASDRRLNIYACQRMIARTTYVRGECLVRLWDRRREDNLPVPFQIQVMEPDYLDITKTLPVDGGYIIHGVEFDLVGRIQAFWLFGNHPGEVIAASTRGLVSKRIPADTVLHHAALERPGDVRAVSRLAPVIAKMRDLDEAGDARLMRQKIEACLALFVGQETGAEGPTLGKITDSDGNRIEEMRPGMIAYGPPGSKPEFFAPSGSGDWAPYKKSELKELSAGMDQPYVVIGEDIADVNYSSYRGGAIDERDSVEEYRWLWFIPQVLDPIWRKFIDSLALTGAIPQGTSYKVKWNPPPFDLLDRTVEAEADRIELQIGKRSWPQLVGEQGYDPAKQIADIKRWKPELEAAGITFAKSTSETSTDGGTNGNNQASGSASQR